MARLLVISSAISLVGAVFELGKLDREIIENQKIIKVFQEPNQVQKQYSKKPLWKQRFEPLKINSV